MATCPECEAEIDVDEEEVDKGDVITCHECGSDLEVVSLTPLELDVAQDDDEDDLEKDDDEDDLDEDDDEEEEWDM
jgi:alpha-aminoadipate/glutamate carrier protein LysW